MKRWLLVIFAAVSAFYLGAASPLENPCLNPVKVQAAPKHAPVKLVSESAALFEIKAEGFNSDKATKALRRAFELAGVREGKTSAARCTIHLVGEGDATKEGFSLVTSASGVTIRGNVLWGVYDFIERFLGVRSYYPGPEGEVHPPVKDLLLAPCAYSDSPRMINRGTYVMYSTRAKEYAAAFGQPNLKESDVELWRNANRVASTDPFRIMHEPEPTSWSTCFTNLIPNLIETSFFQNAQGKRYQSFTSHTGNYFDVTSFDFVENLIKSYKYYYSGKRNPSWGSTGFRYLNSKYIVFGQTDTERLLNEMQEHPVVKREHLITEENVKAGPGGYFSDVYARFYKRLAERIRQEFPDKKLIVMPYNGYTLAPRQKRFYLPDNVEIGVCLRDLPRFAADPKCIEEGRKFLSEWYRALGNRPAQQTWGYAAGNNYFTEAVAFNYEGVFIREMGELLGNEGIFQETSSCCGGVKLPDHALFHYEMYVMLRQMWNPNFDVRAALDEYFELMYGEEAAKPLKEFYALLVSAFEGHAAPKRQTNVLYPITVLNELEKHLNAAKAVLAEGTLERKRYDLFEQPFRYQLTAQRGRHAFNVTQTRVTRLKADEQITVDGRGDEAAWSRAIPAEMMSIDGTGVLPRFAPEVRLLWRDDGLYGLVVQKHAALKSKPNLWQNDTIELFIAPGLDKRAYFQLAFDRSGHLHHLKHVMQPIPLAEDYTWACEGMKYATVDCGEGWSLEFKLPLTAFERVQPKPYESWNYLLVYNRLLSPRETSATSVTLANNHIMNNYGVMKFMGYELEPTAGVPYANTRKYTGYRQDDHVFGASVLLSNDDNYYGLDLLTYKPDRRGETETFFFMTDPRRYGGFGQASCKFLSLTVNDIPLSKINPAPDALKTTADGAPAYHLNFDGAGVVVEARRREGDPLLYLTFRRDKASVAPIRSAKIVFTCFVSTYDQAERYDRFAKTNTRTFGMSKNYNDWQTLEPTDRYLLLADRVLDGSAEDLGYGPSLFRFQKNWQDVESVKFRAHKSYDAHVVITLKPEFKSFSVGILQTQDRTSNADFERNYLGK